VSPLLEIRRLEIAFPGETDPIRVVRGLSLTVGPGEIVGLVGESGSGKSLTAMAAIGLVPPPGRIESGSVLFEGREVRELGASALRRLRGGRIGYLPQEPASALNPVVSCGAQIVETVRAHRSAGREEARRIAVGLLRAAGFERPSETMRRFPGELSGGQRQRVLLAIARAGDPALLIADEPTAALDDVLAIQVLDLLARERNEGRSVLLVTHDLRSVVRICDRVEVVYCGEIVESGSVSTVLARTAHPYTRALLRLTRGGAAAEGGALATIPGQIPAPAALPPGCAFHPRCGERLPACSERIPPWVPRAAEEGGARCLLESPA